MDGTEVYVDGWSLNEGGLIGLNKTLGHWVYVVWLVGSCQNKIY